MSADVDLKSILLKSVIRSLKIAEESIRVLTEGQHQDMFNKEEQEKLHRMKCELIDIRLDCEAENKEAEHVSR